MKALTRSIVLIILLMSTAANAQTYGQLYSKSEADKIYGPVLKEHKIKTAFLQSLISKTNSILMFSFTGDRLIVAGNKRKLLFSSSPDTADLNLSELSLITGDLVLKAFSVSKIQDLLENGKDSETSIEKRKEVISLTNGEYTLELAAGCPPFCF